MTLDPYHFIHKSHRHCHAWRTRLPFSDSCYLPSSRWASILQVSRGRFVPFRLTLITCLSQSQVRDQLMFYCSPLFLHAPQCCFQVVTNLGNSPDKPDGPTTCLAPVSPTDSLSIVTDAYTIIFKEYYLQTGAPADHLAQLQLFHAFQIMVQQAILKHRQSSNSDSTWAVAATVLGCRSITRRGSIWVVRLSVGRTENSCDSRMAR